MKKTQLKIEDTETDFKILIYELNTLQVEQKNLLIDYSKKVKDVKLVKIRQQLNL